MRKHHEKFSLILKGRWGQLKCYDLAYGKVYRRLVSGCDRPKRGGDTKQSKWIRASFRDR